MSDIRFQENFKIRASEIDSRRKATLPAICDLLQEVAGNHAEKLHFDITDLIEDKLTWVLHRLCVKMDRYPDWRETITIQTWPSSGDGLRAYRDFVLLDSEKNTIGKSLSYWLMMNIESRRPARIPQKILDMTPENIDHVLPVRDGSFPEITGTGNRRSYKVRKTDLDLNNHVNNVKYVEWALSCLPDDTKVKEIDIKFVSESILGDTDIAEIQRDHNASNGSFYHQIRRASDDRIIAKAHTST